MSGSKILNILVTITSAVLIVLLIILGVQVLSPQEKNSTFKENVVIGGINVKGLTKMQAETKLSEAVQEKVDNLKLTLRYNGKEWEYSSKDFVVSTKVHTIIDDAYRFTNLNTNKQETVEDISKEGYNFDVAFNYVFKDFDKKLDEIKKEIESDPVDSNVTFNPNSNELFTISKSQNGIKINEDSLYQQIEKQFKVSSTITVDIPTTQIGPNVVEDDFKGKLELLGEFSTDLSTSKGGRKHNVDLALSKFNGKKIESGEEVSFNEVTGPQTKESGYQGAIVIYNGEFVEGIGGGICQASTTLYNALLLSGVEIDEVHKHTLPVGYVELSLDAMVNEGTADLRFKNISSEPIYIKSYVEGDRAYAKIYGQPLEEGVSFKRSVEYVRTIPHKGDKIIPDTKGEYVDKVKYKGEYFRLSYPKEGYEAKGYLEKYIDGEFISREMIRHEIYEPRQGMLIEGTQEPVGGEEGNGVEVIPPQIEVETFSQDIFSQELEIFE